MSETIHQTARALTPADVAGMTGLEVLRGMISGVLPPPPFALTMQTILTEADYGHVVFTGTPKADFLNPLGTIHGGWTATLLDSAMACAVHSALAAGTSYTTLELKLNYVRAITSKLRQVRCEGKLIHLGKQTATSEGRLIDADTGALLAHGTETCLIFG